MASEVRAGVLILAIFATFAGLIEAQDILGCGGFVKSEVEINFSMVEVKLYTKLGSLKYQTDCAPNNGYYMIPVYDKGEYVLKVEPPPGWTFDPQSVELNIDGANDPCSKGEDINFMFTGFGVVGKVVSEGQQTGPQGVTLTLTKPKNSEALKVTTSTEGGVFTFENVLPGEYTVTASHPTWKLGVATVPVSVTKETGNAGNSLSIKGYDLSGSVTSDGEPIRQVYFLLYSKTVKAEKISGCESIKLPGLTEQPLCHVKSQEDGKFLFPSLPHGSYILVPFYKGENIKFDVVPPQVTVEVEHDSVVIEEPFQVAGFSVQGKVLTSAKGSGIEGAQITVNGNAVTTTRSDGTYHLDSMKAGTYNIKVTAAKMTFENTQVKVTANTPHLPDILAARFSVCGKVLIDKVPERLSLNPQRQIVVATKEGQRVAVLTTDANGQFCTELAPGLYNVQVVITEEEDAAGLKLAPSVKEVMVKDSPVDGIVFSQFRAKVSGTISCLETCGVLQLTLTAVGRQDNKRTVQTNEVARGSTFHFTDVMPGKYTVTLHQEDWCWKVKVLEMEVTDKDISGLDFLQTGYILSCSLSHDITLHFAHESKPGTVGSFELSRGVNKFCLAEPGVYQLTPESCHQFEQDFYRYDTSNPTVLTLTAVRHLLEGVVTTHIARKDIKVAIKSSLEDDSQVELGPLKSVQDLEKEKESGKDKPKGKDKDKKKEAEPTGPSVYKFSHWARSGEKLYIAPSSAELLFYPDFVEVVVQGDTCAGLVAEFEGKQGVFITGKISPPLAKVAISITPTGATDAIITMETTDSGTFRAGPLHSGVQYDVAAHKEGYILTKKEGSSDFQAFKLGEVKVKVVDEAGSSNLAGVLLSLSGGSQYRSNQLTKEDGTMIFSSLGPGQYFLRPMMKEYLFEPASQMIDVLEGSTLSINIKGKRVAFSCYGILTSLNGEPEPGVVIEAVTVSSENCNFIQEESKTEQDGTFRIRGLQPSCEYVIRLKSGDVNHHIERTTPKSKSIRIGKDDLKDVHIIAFRKMNQLDLSGNVITDQEYLNTLKVRLYKEMGDSPLHTTSMGATSFFYLPSLTIDNQNYILRLESTLSKGSYDYNQPEVMFTANVTYKHFTFQFQPKRKSLDQEINQGSFLMLPMTLIIIFLGYNYDKVWKALTQGSSLLQGAMARPSGGSQSSSNTPLTAVYPELLEETSAPKKKKVKKT